MGSRVRNCYRAIRLRRSWLSSGKGRGDGLRRPLGAPVGSATHAGQAQLLARIMLTGEYRLPERR